MAKYNDGYYNDWKSLVPFVLGDSVEVGDKIVAVQDLLHGVTTGVILIVRAVKNISGMCFTDQNDYTWRVGSNFAPHPNNDRRYNNRSDDRSPCKLDGTDGPSDSGYVKSRWELLPYEALDEVAKVLTAGAIKYSDNNWRRGQPDQFFGAMMRHVAAWKAGETIDDDLHERGFDVSPLACVACNALFMLALEIQNGGKNESR